MPRRVIDASQIGPSGVRPVANPNPLAIPDFSGLERKNQNTPEQLRGEFGGWSQSLDNVLAVAGENYKNNSVQEGENAAQTNTAAALKTADGSPEAFAKLVGNGSITEDMNPYQALTYRRVISREAAKVYHAKVASTIESEASDAYQQDENGKFKGMRPAAEIQKGVYDQMAPNLKDITDNPVTGGIFQGMINQSDLDTSAHHEALFKTYTRDVARQGATNEIADHMMNAFNITGPDWKEPTTQQIQAVITERAYKAGVQNPAEVAASAIENATERIKAQFPTKGAEFALRFYDSASKVVVGNTTLESNAAPGVSKKLLAVRDGLHRDAEVEERKQRERLSLDRESETAKAEATYGPGLVAAAAVGDAAAQKELATALDGVSKNPSTARFSSEIASRLHTLMDVAKSTHIYGNTEADLKIVESLHSDSTLTATDLMSRAKTIKDPSLRIREIDYAEQAKAAENGVAQTPEVAAILSTYKQSVANFKPQTPDGERAFRDAGYEGDIYNSLLGQARQKVAPFIRNGGLNTPEGRKALTDLSNTSERAIEGARTSFFEPRTKQTQAFDNDILFGKKTPGVALDPKLFTPAEIQTAHDKLEHAVGLRSRWDNPAESAVLFQPVDRFLKDTTAGGAAEGISAEVRRELETQRDTLFLDYRKEITDYAKQLNSQNLPVSDFNSQMMRQSEWLANRKAVEMSQMLAQKKEKGVKIADLNLKWIAKLNAMTAGKSPADEFAASSAAAAAAAPAMKAVHPNGLLFDQQTPEMQARILEMRGRRAESAQGGAPISPQASGAQGNILKMRGSDQGPPDSQPADGETGKAPMQEAPEGPAKDLVTFQQTLPQLLKAGSHSLPGLFGSVTDGTPKELKIPDSTTRLFGDDSTLANATPFGRTGLAESTGGSRVPLGGAGASMDVNSVKSRLLAARMTASSAGDASVTNEPEERWWGAKYNSLADKIVRGLPAEARTSSDMTQKAAALALIRHVGIPYQQLAAGELAFRPESEYGPAPTTSKEAMSKLLDQRSKMADMPFPGFPAASSNKLLKSTTGRLDYITVDYSKNSENANSAAYYNDQIRQHNVLLSQYNAAKVPITAADAKQINWQETPVFANRADFKVAADLFADKPNEAKEVTTAMKMLGIDLNNTKDVHNFWQVQATLLGMVPKKKGS